jgi:8-oxo-dGTP pyrophosphatase MutT (NUDIX family)
MGYRTPYRATNIPHPPRHGTPHAGPRAGLGCRVSGRALGSSAMHDPRPAPGEELNLGDPTAPRLAATVIVLRGDSAGLEILLVKRNPQSRFMGGAWVFPGGAVHSDDGSGEPALRAAAVRELREEAGITLSDPGALVLFSRWITPAQVKIRFDTWFYLAPLPDGADPRPDGGEVVEARWYEPQEALAAGGRGELLLVFPTIKHLEQLSGFASAQALLDHARGREVMPVEPQVVGSGETARIVLPGEPGYEA